ncbi:MAG: hypothetical protein IJG50_01995 [Clostridia bacterium]|nr:hypothetical protein [Clostridia bacterium]
MLRYSKLPKSRIVLFPDEQISPEQTKGVKKLRKTRLIDGFLHASILKQWGYLADTLESI